MARNTQEQQVKEMLGKYGYVTNFWAIQNYILRLGAIIKNLRDDGIEIEGMFGAKLNGTPRSHAKNFYYFTKRSVYKDKNGKWTSNVNLV